MKRVFVLLIVLSMMLSLLIACSGSSNGSKDTTQAPVSSPADTTADPDIFTVDIEPIDESLAALNYGGDRTITILARGNTEDWSTDELWVEELTSDPINDSIYNRNLAVCDILGLKDIVQISADGRDALQQKATLMVESGDTTYDIVAASVYYGTPMIDKGMMYNLYSNGIDTYLDPTKPWWSNYWIKQAEMGDRLYCITGAPALTLTRLMFVMYYNKNLATDLQVEDMYTVVNEGRWTIDYLNEIVSGLYHDNDGNSIKDETDRYGLTINHYENCDMFWSAFDMTILTKDEDGWFVFDNSDKEKISIAFDKVFYLIHENPGSFDTGDGNGFYISRDMFADGNTLFAALHLKFAESHEFRNMQDEYGILPIPKYNEKQDDYYTYAHDQYTVFMVPKTVDDPELSGAVLETMAYESYRTVQPAYYNVVLKGRYANDPESRKMLDAITTNFTLDPAWIYGQMFNLPTAKVFRTPIFAESRTFASNYAGIEKKLPFMIKEIKKIISKIEY